MPNPLVALGGASAGSAAYGSHQARKASKAQVEAGDRAAQLEKESADKQLALQREIWEKQQADYKPYLEQGTWGINRLGDLMRNQTPAYNSSSGFNQTPAYNSSSGFNARRSGFNAQRKSRQFSNSYNSSSGFNATIPTPNANGGQLNNPFDSYLASKGLAGGRFDTNNPAYQFQLKQGQQALDRSAAARGMGYSGAQLKALNEYGQGLASQQYDKEYNRANNEFTDYYNRLASLSQGGQQAAQSLGGLGSNYSLNAANTFANLSNAQTSILGQQANARASGYAGRANAFNQGLGNMIDIYGISKKYG